MPQIPIIMPQLGESIAEAIIVNFLVSPGDSVEADQDLVEVETNKATMNVASPCRGKVEKFLARMNESYPVGATLGYLEASQEDAARLGLDSPPVTARPPRIPTNSSSKIPGRVFGRRCGACRCRPTPPAPAICRRG
jgi:pyruvate/2-oxoglutarate dehydrogenase complex dihydrolipoamide acyltransferase (E2) component